MQHKIKTSLSLCNPFFIIFEKIQSEKLTKHT